MKRLSLVLAGALAATSLYAVAAPAGQEDVSPRRVRALERKVATLQRTVSSLQRTANNLNGVVSNCLLSRAVPAGVYGNPPGTGYLYRFQDGTTAATTGLDLVPQGQAPQFWVLTTTTECANAINSPNASLRRLARAVATAAPTRGTPLEKRR